VVPFNSLTLNQTLALKKRRDDLNLQRLELAEAGTLKGDGRAAGDKAGEESEGEGNELEEADEFEMDDDYGVDHYASDDGDGEAVY